MEVTWTEPRSRTPSAELRRDCAPTTATSRWYQLTWRYVLWPRRGIKITFSDLSAFLFGIRLILLWRAFFSSSLLSSFSNPGLAGWLSTFLADHSSGVTSYPTPYMNDGGWWGGECSVHSQPASRLEIICPSPIIYSINTNI